MERISINLLPKEFTQAEVKRAKFYRVQAFGVSTVLVMIFLSSLTVALRVLQSHNIGQAQAQVTQAEQRVTTLKNRQASLLLLKNRLTSINRYLGVSSKQAATFELVSDLLPASVVVTSITIGQSGQVSVSVLIPDAVTLDNLITSLTSKEINQDKLSQISIESLNRGRDGMYRAGLKIKPKS